MGKSSLHSQKIAQKTYLLKLGFQWPEEQLKKLSGKQWAYDFFRLVFQQVTQGLEDQGIKVDRGEVLVDGTIIPRGTSPTYHYAVKGVAKWILQALLNGTKRTAYDLASDREGETAGELCLSVLEWQIQDDKDPKIKHRQELLDPEDELIYDPPVPKPHQEKPPYQFSKREEQLAGEIIALIPTDFAGAKAQLHAWLHRLKSEYAQALTAPFAHLMKTKPHATLKEKQALCMWANEALRSVGLAFCCRHANGAIEPGVLVAEPYGEQGRFRLFSKGKHGPQKKMHSSVEVPEFPLMPDEPRQEGRARWSEKVKGTPKPKSEQTR